MNYINQLTKDDIRELFVVLTGVGKTFDITLEDDLLCGKNHRTNTSYLIDLDDYYVDGSAKATKKYRKFMLNKFGKQYMEDCFWNDFGGDEIVKMASANPNLDTINGWRQVIDQL